MTLTGPQNNSPERILVIRLGALGDLVLCFQAFHEIRYAHPEAEIVLLTTPAFADFAALMPWFDRVMIDERPSGWKLGKWAHLLQKIRAFKPTRVYDLQGKFRQTALYFALGGPFGPQWSGAAPLCKFPRPWPPAKDMHFTDFVAAQLNAAGVTTQRPPDLGWLDAPLDGFSVPGRYVMFIPGCAPGREYKRWPAKHYADLALRLREKGIHCIAVGTKQDAAAIMALRKDAPHVIDFSGRTRLPELASLARRSVGVVGNDTGPSHLSAAIGVTTLTLISEHVNPAWSVPRGRKSYWVQGKPLSTLGVNEVFVALMKVVASP